MFGLLKLRRRGYFPGLAGIALLAMVLRALIPAGYMPSGGEGGNFLTLTLCTAHGMVDVLVDPATGAVVDAGANGQDTGDTGKDAPCVFAGMVAFAAPLAPPSLLPPPSFHAAAPVEAGHIAHKALDSESPWSTGPPSLI